MKSQVKAKAGAYDATRKKGVAAFMKATGRDTYVELLRRDRAAFFGKNGKPKPSMVELASCPACDAPPARGKPVFDKDGFPYARCGDCRTLYVATPLRETHLVRYYESSKAVAAWNQVLQTPAQLDYDRRKFARLLDAALERLPASPKRKRILDVGASICTFPVLCAERGHEAFAVEISEDARRIAQERYGLGAVHRTLEDAAAAIPKGSLDLVTFFEVIEHLKHPGAVLDQVTSLLKPGGLMLALVGGNCDSIAMRLMRERSLAFDFTRLAYYSPTSFAALLGRHGLEAEHADSIIPEVDVALSYLRWDDPYKPDLEDDVIPPWFRASLERLTVERTMGYKFWLVARKPLAAPARKPRGKRARGA